MNAERGAKTRQNTAPGRPALGRCAHFTGWLDLVENTAIREMLRLYFFPATEDVFDREQSLAAGNCLAHGGPMTAGSVGRL